MALTPEEIPSDVVQREKRIATEQAAESGKPPAVQEKMIAGKVRKFLAENSLLEQPFVRDDKKKVRDVLGKARAVAFARFAVGQGE
jgi:elongation factor Ts